MNLEEKFEKLMEYVEDITDNKLRELVKKLLIDKKQDLMNRAGSPDRIENGIYYKGNHHFFKGGLLCHLLETTEYAVNIAKTSNKETNMDVLICGACLHDIGKIITYQEWNDENQVKNPSTIYASKVQHSYLGMKIVSEYLNKKIKEEIELDILHIIASHMSRNGSTTCGALVIPVTIEAKIVSEADNIDCLLCNYDEKYIMRKIDEQDF